MSPAQGPVRLPAVLSAWGSPAFDDTLKHELARLSLEALPLQQALSRTSHTDGTKRAVLILATSDTADQICVTAGIFYTGIIAGCSCTDDPTPMSEINEYCEVQIEIDKATAAAHISLLSD